MKIIHVHAGVLPIPPNGWGAVEKIIWEYHQNCLKLGYDSEILYLDDIKYEPDMIIHTHMANLANLAYERNIPYYFSFHDHHAVLYGKNSECFADNLKAIKNSIKTFVPAKYLVDYFGEPNMVYLSHGVNNDFFKPAENKQNKNRLLCVANNGFFHDASEDRKGFGFAIEAAQELNLPITIAGPKINKHFFDKYKSQYDKLNIIYDLSEDQLLKIYQEHDIFLNPSVLEAGHPNLTLLEAISCKLPTLSTFENNNELKGLIKITRDSKEIAQKIKEVIQNYSKYEEECAETIRTHSWNNIVQKLISEYKKFQMKDQLLNIYRIIEQKNRTSKEIENKFLLHLNDGCKFEVTGPNDKEYDVVFKDKKNNIEVYRSRIKNNMWCAPNTKYFVDWNIEITEIESREKTVYNLDLNGKIVKIVNESPSLGDVIAWIPMVSEFQKKHNCKVHLYTPNKQLFEKEYENINFFNYGDIAIAKYYAVYKLGYFNIKENRTPYDVRHRNLQQVCADILGLDYQEIKTKIHVKHNSRRMIEKYICISIASTAGCKHWQNETGWQQTVDYLNDLGYKVVVIQKENLDYMDLKGLNNVVHPETKTLDEAISWLANCEFFIGLGSGISWLAWALNKKVILISGFSLPFSEFNTDYRVINNEVCNGCWNDTQYEFDGGNWNWCPRNKNFECSKSISFKMVKDKINNALKSNAFGK